MTIQSPTIWIDLLCWSSAFKTVIVSISQRPSKIYFINVSRLFVPFVIYFEKIVKVPVVQINHIVAGEEKLEGISLYEILQLRMESFLDQWLESEHLASSNAAFCQANALNLVKYTFHLKETAYNHLYRPVEMGVWADYLSNQLPCIFIIRYTPFADVIERCLGSVIFYRTCFAHMLSISNRPDYVFDTYFNKDYFAGRFRIVGKFLYRWFIDLIGCLVRSRRANNGAKEKVMIGIELSQNRVRLDQINDINWLEASGISMDQVCGLQMEVFDEHSVELLDAQKISRFSLAGRSSSRHSHRGSSIVSIQLRYLISTFVLILGLIKCLIFWNERSWFHLQSVRYLYYTIYWYSIYDQLGIKVLWTMYDMDEEKLAKGQAMELLGGIYTGGHWSNFPLYQIYNQKCYDVLFAWGEHFVHNNFNRYPFMAIFFTGYPCDYYFAMHKDRAKDIRKRHDGKFIVSYHDNIMGHDLPYSKNMQLDIHRVLISLLHKFENVVVLLKPKRKFLLDEIVKELPELQELIDLGRIEVFLGDTARTKAVPAQIGMASDLVIGLGISTTAAESFFAGTVAFHADLTGFERNEFANRGEGVVVFRDVFTLEKAIIDRITGTNKWKYKDYKGYYMGLDPFMDGYSAQRMGYLIKRMRDYLAQGVSREELLPKLSRDYDSYLLSQSNWQKMSWN